MSSIYILNESEPRIDPRGTPEKISFLRLKSHFTFVFCNLIAMHVGETLQETSTVNFKFNN